MQNSTLNSRAAVEANIDRDFKLQHFTYNNTSILEVLDHYLSETDFLGISGRIKFDQDGIRDGRRLFIYQMRYNNSGHLIQHEIARVDENFTFTYSNNETDESVWPGEDWIYVHFEMYFFIATNCLVNTFFCVLQ